jgi:transposase
MTGQIGPTIKEDAMEGVVIRVDVDQAEAKARRLTLKEIADFEKPRQDLWHQIDRLESDLGHKIEIKNRLRSSATTLDEIQAVLAKEMGISLDKAVGF